MAWQLFAAPEMVASRLLPDVTCRAFQTMSFVNPAITITITSTITIITITNKLRLGVSDFGPDFQRWGGGGVVWRLLVLAARQLQGAVTTKKTQGESSGCVHLLRGSLSITHSMVPYSSYSYSIIYL